MLEAMEQQGWLADESREAPANRHIRSALVEAIHACTAPEGDRAQLVALLKNVRGQGLRLDLAKHLVGFGSGSADDLPRLVSLPVRPDVLSVRIVHRTLMPFGSGQTVRFKVQLRESADVEIVLPALGGVVGPDGNGLPSHPVGKFEAREYPNEPLHMKRQRAQLGVAASAYVLRDGTELEVPGVPNGQEEAFSAALSRDLRRTVRLRVAGQAAYNPDSNDPLDWDW